MCEVISLVNKILIKLPECMYVFIYVDLCYRNLSFSILCHIDNRNQRSKYVVCIFCSSNFLL